MTSNHMESEKVLSTVEPNGNGLGPKVVETIAKSFIDQEEKKLICTDSARTAKWSVPANETIVEREIREQRERETALACQRAAAVLHKKAAEKSLVIQGNNDLKDETWVKNSNVRSKVVNKVVGHFPNRGSHITLELHKVTDEEEQKYVEDIETNNTQKDNVMKCPDRFNSEKDNSLENLSNDFYFQCSSKDSWQSDSSQNVDLSQSQIQDLDSSISAQSAESGSNTSHEFHATRSIVVKPLSEPEDDTSNYIRWQKETPIEREIRLTREREEELRREKGLLPLPSINNVSTKKSEVQKFSNRRNTALNDCRSVQHRIATSRIQQEINEATEREKELHAAGLIQTISEDTVDSKVTRFTDLAGFAIEETERKLRRAVSTSFVAGEPESQSFVASTPYNGQKPSFRPPVENTSNHSINSTPISSKKFGPRVGHKGVMQRFLASHGRVNPINAYSKPNQFSPISYSPAISTSISSKDIGPKIDLAEHQVSDDSSRKNSRRGYLSAEEKIQAELQEMQKREEELRLQRAQIFAQSQPNLLSIGDFEDTELNHVSEGLNSSSAFGHNESNSHLENSRDADGESSFTELSQWNTRKKSSLIAQWENRIQQSMQSDLE